MTNNPKKSADVYTEFNSCMMSSSTMFYIGVVLGTVVGYRTKNYRPLLAGTLGGTLGDAINGYCFSCSHLKREADQLKHIEDTELKKILDSKSNV